MTKRKWPRKSLLIHYHLVLKDQNNFINLIKGLLITSTTSTSLSRAHVHPPKSRASPSRFHLLQVYQTRTLLTPGGNLNPIPMQCKLSIGSKTNLGHLATRCVMLFHKFLQYPIHIMTVLGTSFSGHRVCR